MAQKVVAGAVKSWAELGEPPGRLTVARGSTDPAARDAGTVAVVPANRVGPHVRVVDVAGVDPMREPQRYPLRTTARAAPPQAVTMTVVGDIMLGRRVGARSARTGDPAAPLRPLSRRLAAADVTVGNLESTLSRAGPPTHGGDSFAADPRVVRGLRAAGFDVMSLANNHLGDFGPRALTETVGLLRTGGIRTFGAGANPTAAWQPAVVASAGIRFGFLGFNAIGETPEVAPGRPGAVSVRMPPRTGPLNRTQLRRFLEAVRALDRQVDVVVVLPHWGRQYTNRPEPVQHTVADQLVRAGADVVVGGHPHWVQGPSIVHGVLVVHSLGNFVFDMAMPQSRVGVLLELVFWGPRLVQADYVPYRIGPDYAPRLQSWAAAGGTMRQLWAFSGLGATTR